ncbi:MAG: thioredoxin family protein [Bacteroidia bacterium]
MKKFIAAIIFLFVSFIALCQDKKEGLVWYDNLMKANDASTAAKKPIFAFFTGSDWCVWCRKLQNDVFSKPEFVQWANKNVILLELDFPRGKQLSPETSQQNNELQQLFQVRGYPTIWLFNMVKDSVGKYNINTYGSLGYPQGAIPGKEEVKFINDGDLLLAPKTNNK